MRRLLAAGLLVAAVLAGLVGPAASPALAHAALLESTPQDGLLLQGAPRTVSLRFSEPVSPSLGAVRVTAPDGSRVDDGAPVLSAGGTVVTTGVDLDQPGTHVLSWRVVSQDSHPVSGISTFSVGRETAAAEVGAADSGAGPLLAGSRLLGFAGVLLLIGNVVLVLAVWPGARGLRAVRVLAGTAVALVAVGAVGGLLLQGPHAAGLPVSRALDPALLREVLASPYGVGHLLRLALLPLVAVALVLLLRRRADPGRGSAVAAAATGVPLLATWPLSGHASAGELTALALPLDALHLLAVGAWAGGLVVLGLAVLRRAPEEALRALLPRWSRVAGVAVVAMVATGLFASWREVGSPAALTGTDYGRLLLLKTVLVVLMLGLGNAGRAWIRTRVSLPVAHATTTLDPAPRTLAAEPLAQLRRTVLVETVLGVVVVAVTAVLVGLAPARTAYAEPLSVTRPLGPASAVQVDLDTAVVGVNALHVYLTGPGGKAFDAPEVTVRLSRPGGETFTEPLPRKSLGHYETTTLAVPYAGTWRLDVSVRTTDVDVQTASLTTTFRAP